MTKKELEEIFNRDLPPCPFCGHPARGPHKDENNNYWWVECSAWFVGHSLECCLSVDAKTKEEVIKKWTKLCENSRNSKNGEIMNDQEILTKLIDISNWLNIVNKNNLRILFIGDDQIQTTAEFFKVLAKGKQWEVCQYEDSVHVSAIIDGVKLVAVFR